MKTSFFLSFFLVLTFTLSLVTSANFAYNTGGGGGGASVVYSNITVNVSHNALSGLQGGAANDYYHFTNAEHTSLLAGLLNWVTQSVLEAYINANVSSANTTMANYVNNQFVPFSGSTANVTLGGNLTASYLFGNGSQLTDVASYNSTYAAYNSTGLIQNWSSTLSGDYVPYTGATKNVTLGLHNVSLNGSIEFLERTSNAQDLFFVNPFDGDGFHMEYWYNFEAVNDDWLVFRKSDGNDVRPDGGIAFMMSNSSGWNKTTLKLDGYGLANFTDYNITTEGNITTAGKYFVGNGTYITDVAKYQFGANNFNGSGSFNTTGNITTSGYFMGQPLLGMLGSGIIQSNQTNLLSEVNVTCSGLTCSYNAFEVRLVSGTSDQFATYCKIPAGSKVVSNNAHNVLYIDSSCNIVETTITTFFDTLLSSGSIWDFANMVCYNNACTEVVNGIGLEQRRMMKQRIVNYNLNNLKVTDGFAKTTIAWPNFNLTSGKYIYLMDVVSVPEKETGAGNVEIMFQSGGTWTMVDQDSMNFTTCQTSTGIAACGNTNRWRRVFFFMIGWNETTDTSGIHQLLPSQTIYYNSQATCLDTVATPLTYSLPDFYTHAAVPLYAYCARPQDTAWSSTGWIDLRTVRAGTASGSSTGDFVPYTGAAQNVNLGSYNLTAAGMSLTQSFILNTTGLSKTAFHAYGDVDNYYELDIKNVNNGSSASSDYVATANNGNDTNYYIDMGINSQNYSDPAWTINGKNDGYLYVQDGNLAVGTSTVGKILQFFLGGTLIANEQANITTSGLNVKNNITANYLSVAEGINISSGDLYVMNNQTAKVIISSGVGNENATIEFREEDNLRGSIEYGGVSGLIRIWSKYTDGVFDVLMSLNTRTNEVKIPSGSLNVSGGNVSINSGNKFCYTQACDKYSYYNGTQIIIQG